MTTTRQRLLVFLKAPRAGAVKTRLAQVIGAADASTAYRELAETLLDTLSPLPFVELCFTPDNALVEIKPWLRRDWLARPQGEGDLGSRLTKAFEDVFAEGADRVVIIGSDCPTVTVDDIERAWSALRTHDLALGPATDGGYWLIGLRAPQPLLFAGITWSSEKVFSETMERAKRGGLRVHLLREQADVDTAADWEWWKRRPSLTSRCRTSSSPRE